ncbi:hypothetical protein EIN_053570 [Entamoeba invadens IP1]|uniref:hypothetical protein n=1 Tax=Entamoeba invadens IP1 TaxID=370355 RepID=UPI0002C3F53F|nr:hypothetical protein EIN_053570 [Entamoeba invadens IP1]ELP93112.1 hypothetical protein EIN_053570 [Entamoeba invadens IP1]|eukprot:XP_004259883.1 hypothetical protein EIN_053570 [Entamoeba invadens IP1]
MHTHTAVSPTSKQKQAVDITNTSEFIAFQNVFEEQLSAKIPWCPVCLKKSQSSLSETLVRCFKQRKVETEKLEELQTLSEIIDSEIRAEEEQLKQLESDILFLHEKNSLVVYVYSELCNDLRLFRTTSSTHFSQIACLEKVVLKSSVVPDLSLLNLQIERLQNDRRIWGDIFEVSWTDGGVTICGVNPVESIKAKNYTEVQASFGMIISLIKKVAFYSGAFLQKTCIDGFGYGGFVVNHTDFSNVSRSKFKNGLKGVLVAFEEVSTFLSETTNFELPFPITKSEYFQIYSFTDTSNLDQWAVALKFFVSDLGYMFSYVFFN